MQLSTCLPSAAVLVVLAFPAAASEAEWLVVTGKETLTAFMSGLTAERTLPNGEVSRGEYAPDGTGVLYAWGETFPRKWRIEGEDQLCVAERRAEVCYYIDKHATDSGLYRVRDTASDQQYEFQVTDKVGTVEADPREIGDQGGAATASADELAAELSNPNTAVASLTFKNQFRWFDGTRRAHCVRIGHLGGSSEQRVAD